MKIEYYQPLWGNESLPFESFLEKVKLAGYDGVEMPFFLYDESPKNITRKIQLLKEYKLKLIAQHFETVCSDVELYKKEFEERLIILAENAPLFINSQTGRDFFTQNDNLALIDIASKVEDLTGVTVLHETHRGRFSFASHVTKQFLQKRPELKLTADLSHWCCVAGTMLEDQTQTLSDIFENVHHIHSRVGHSEGPQVANPSAPEVENELAIHTKWWQKIIDVAKQRGQQTFTITTEFGPKPYMPIEPFTEKELANQWDCNVFMKNHLQASLHC